MMSWLWGSNPTPAECAAAQSPSETNVDAEGGNNVVCGRTLTEDQLEALETMRARIKDENDAFCKFPLSPAFPLSDSTLMRYLRARKWSVDDAAKMLLATLEWRAKMGVDKWRGPRDFGWQYVRGKQYHHGFDKKGRPIVVMRSHNAPQHATDQEVLEFMLYMFEKVIQVMGDGVEQAIWLMDMSTYDLRYNGGLSFAIKLVSALQHHYPERLGHLLIQNSPVMFKPMWAMVKPFVDPTTREKIQFVNYGDELLLELIDKATLEQTFGGECEGEYDHKAYMQVLSDLDVALFGPDAATVEEKHQFSSEATY